jgi:C_GCAxxG_C_C family probable redox protein
LSASDVAVDLFRAGCACSQGVLAAYADRFGLEEAAALRIASGFAAGMRRGDTCGAVTGALMVLGLAHAGDDCRTIEGRQTVNGAVTRFADRFRERHGSLICRELLGCDLSTPEGQAEARARGLFVTRCPLFVRDAAELVGAQLPA